MVNNNFKRSAEILKKAKRIIPCASQTYSKSYKYFCEGAAPAFLERGDGAHVWDVDGNRYIDFILGLGAITVGYNCPEINAAVERQLRKGISFSQPSPLEVELAEKLISIIPCAEMAKFVKNGSDATGAAVRLARAFTGKDMILCCGYHGWHDWYIGSTENNLGVPRCVQKLTRVFKYNDLNSLKVLFEKHRNQVGAVIMEPVRGDGPDIGYLRQVREITHRHKAVLIFDEVVTGFRIGLSGAQGYYNVIPDLASFGKGMANGLPLSAVVGRRDIMRLIEKGAFISTTFGGEALSLAGALASIKILERKNAYGHFWKIGGLFKKRMQALVEKHGLNDAAKIEGLAPHCGIVFKSKGNLTNYELASVFQQNMIKGGILTIGVNNFCLSHTLSDIDKFVDAADEALEKVSLAVNKDSIKGMLAGGKISPVFKR